MVMKVHRSRKTRREWRFETERVIVQAGEIPPLREGELAQPALLIGFDLDAAGGGKTSVIFSAPPDTFERLVSNMAAVDRDATEKAFLRLRPRRTGL